MWHSHRGSEDVQQMILVSKIRLRSTKFVQRFSLQAAAMLAMLIQYALLPIAFAQSEKALPQNPTTASGDELVIPEAKINAANALVRDGELDRALQMYEHLGPLDSHRDTVNYNKAVAEYRKGNLEAAEQHFTEAVAGNDADIVAKARYNLGNCFYSKGVKNAPQDKVAAIEQLKQAITHYRSALRSDATLTDARVNIELAAALIRQLQQEQQQQDQNQDQQQDQQQQQDDQNGQQDKNSKPDQQSEDQQQDSNEQQSEQQNSDQQKKQDANKSPDGENTKQQDGEQDKDDSGESKGGDNANEQSSEQLAKQSESGNTDKEQTPNSQQQSANDQQQKQDSDDGSEAIEKPSENEQSKSNPQGNLTAGNQSNAEAASESSQSSEQKRTLSMTREEAMKMLQAVRDRDMLRRLQQERAERSRRITVDKDW